MTCELILLSNVQITLLNLDTAKTVRVQVCVIFPNASLALFNIICTIYGKNHVILNIH